MDKNQFVLTFKDDSGSLPDEGWIHKCIFCDNPTGCIEKVFSHKAYICGQCSKKLSKLSKVKFINDNYILFFKIYETKK
jgi:hypothetical protein